MKSETMHLTIETQVFIYFEFLMLIQMQRFFLVSKNMFASSVDSVLLVD